MLYLVFLTVALLGSPAQAKNADGGMNLAQELAKSGKCKVTMKNLELDPENRGTVLNDFLKKFKSWVFGQDQAVEAVTEEYGKVMAGTAPHDRPYSKILLIGPTGVGKTEVIRGFIRTLGANLKKTLLKIDCGEYQQGHETAKMVGSPAGYAGYGEKNAKFDPENLKKLRSDKIPFNVILFDEIEKAAQTLNRMLLGVLDTGDMELGDNRSVDVKQAFIFGTSNLGVKELVALQEARKLDIKQKLDNGDTLSETQLDLSGRKDPVFAKEIDAAMLGAVKEHFSPEFLNRWDKVIVMRNLTRVELDPILDKEMAIVQSQMLTNAKKKFVVLLNEDAKDQIILEGTNIEKGARELQRTIQKRVSAVMGNLINSEQVTDGDVVEMGYNKVSKKFVLKVHFNFDDPGVLMDISRKQYPGFDFDQYFNDISEAKTSGNKVGDAAKTRLQGEAQVKDFYNGLQAERFTGSDGVIYKYVRDNTGRVFAVGENKKAIDANKSATDPKNRKPEYSIGEIKEGDMKPAHREKIALHDGEILTPSK